MTHDAVRHLQRANLHDLLHLADIAVADGARYACLNMRVVCETGVIR
jgi:hypothetical protein